MALPRGDTLKRLLSLSEPRTFRSSQLDAERLDEDLHTMLHEQLMRSLSYLNPRWAADFAPELKAVLEALVLRFSVWTIGASPGASLLNLRYRNERGGGAGASGPGPSTSLSATAGASSAPRNAAAGAAAATASGVPGSGPSAQAGSGARADSGVGAGPPGLPLDGLSTWQKLVFVGGLVGTRYLWSRLGTFASRHGWPDMPDGSWQSRLWSGMAYTEAGARVAGLINLVLFLYEGRYRTLLERLAGARLVPRNPSLPRILTFEYLNRQLVWQEVSNLVLAVLPLLNPRRARRLLRDLWEWIQAAWGALQAALSGAGAGAPNPPPAAGGSAEAEPQPQPNPPGAAGEAGQARAGGAAPASSVPSVSGAAAVRASHGTAPKCVLCGASEACNPFLAVPCGHCYCYYCLRANLEADPRYRCADCYQPVTGLVRGFTPAQEGQHPHTPRKVKKRT